MLDPDEGVDERGMITTGVRRERVVAVFRPVLDAVVAEVRAVAPDAAVYLYGSVATGQAQLGRSDVDVLTIGLDPDEAASISARLSERFGHLCRGVAIAPAAGEDMTGDGAETYGFEVFLRHYCLHLAGPDPAATLPDAPADRAAARGLNGDVSQHLARWQGQQFESAADVLGRRMARKLLLAAAGLVSVHDGTWTTDRATAARRLGEIHPRRADDLAELLQWAESDPNIPGDVVIDERRLRRHLQRTGPWIVERFTRDIGLWGPRVPTALKVVIAILLVIAVGTHVAVGTAWWATVLWLLAFAAPGLWWLERIGDWSHWSADFLGAALLLALIMSFVAFGNF